MKKRVVAFLLSMTLCSAMVAEAGAAAYVDPVSGVSQEAAEVSEEAFSDSEDTGFADQGQTEDAQTEEPGVTEEDGIVIEGSEEEQQPSDGASDIITDDTEDSVVDGETEGAEDVPAEDDSTEETDRKKDLWKICSAQEMRQQFQISRRMRLRLQKRMRLRQPWLLKKKTKTAKQ